MGGVISYNWDAGHCVAADEGHIAHVMSAFRSLMVFAVGPLVQPCRAPLQINLRMCLDGS